MTQGNTVPPVDPRGAARTVEFDVEEGYRLWAEVYDSEYNPLIAVEKRIVEGWLARISFASVLDAGAGTGRWAIRLARADARVTAIDRTPEMLASARRKAADEGLDITFDTGRIDERLPYEGGSFDLVVCALVLDHLDDLKPPLAEFARVLRPGGHAMVTDFHPEMVAAGGRSEFTHEGTRHLLPNPEHTRDCYLDAVTAAGLEVIELNEPRVSALPEPVRGIFQTMFGDLKFCIAILAAKPT
jgi:ubiquinone/menaquinone biosynthesis C-methylase UbiE